MGGAVDIISDIDIQWLVYISAFIICYLLAATSSSVMASPLGGDVSSYLMMKECHEKAYSLISEALDIDESGLGICN